MADQHTLKSFADLKMLPLEWVWKDLVLGGSLNLLTGAPWMARVAVAAMIAARVTTGEAFPDGALALKGKVVWWSGEEDYSRAVLPRLHAAGADLRHLQRPSEDFQPEDAGTYDVLASLLNEGDLLVLDPVSALTLGARSGQRATDVRRAVQPVLALCRDTGCGVLGIARSRKSPGATALEQMEGSGEWGDVASSILAVARSSWVGNGGPAFVLAQAKSRHSPIKHGGWGFRLVDSKVRKEGSAVGVPTSVATDFAWRTGDPEKLLRGAHGEDNAS